MEIIREYVLGMAAAALICAITLCFAEKGKTQPLFKLLCGLILTFSLIRPILSIREGDFRDLFLDYGQEGKAAAQQGKEQAEKTVREIIKEETEAYILDKAQALGLSIQAEVTLSEAPVPVPLSAKILGSVPPYQRTQLTKILKEELGIRKENLTWISRKPENE